MQISYHSYHLRLRLNCIAGGGAVCVLGRLVLFYYPNTHTHILTRPSSGRTGYLQGKWVVQVVVW
jgi:hypothetical protein